MLQAQIVRRCTEPAADGGIAFAIFRLVSIYRRGPFGER